MLFFAKQKTAKSYHNQLLLTLCLIFAAWTQGASGAIEVSSMNADDLRQEVQDLPKTFGKLTAASEQKALYFVKLKRIRALTQQSKVTAEHIQNALSELNKFKTYEVRQ